MTSLPRVARTHRHSRARSDSRSAAADVHTSIATAATAHTYIRGQQRLPSTSGNTAAANFCCYGDVIYWIIIARYPNYGEIHFRHISECHWQCSSSAAAASLSCNGPAKCLSITSRDIPTALKLVMLNYCSCKQLLHAYESTSTL